MSHKAREISLYLFYFRFLWMLFPVVAVPGHYLGPNDDGICRCEYQVDHVCTLAANRREAPGIFFGLLCPRWEIVT